MGHVSKLTLYPVWTRMGVATTVAVPSQGVRSGPVGLVPITRHLLYLVDIEMSVFFF